MTKHTVWKIATLRMTSIWRYKGVDMREKFNDF